MRDTIPEMAEVAALLNDATDAHLVGDFAGAELLLREADRPIVRAWTESLWGSRKANPEQWRYRRARQVAIPEPYLPQAGRVPQRRPDAGQQASVIATYGRHCVFCGVPLIRAEVRAAFHRIYPEAVPWGSTNLSCHAGFQALWLQFDHLVPHSRRGSSASSNIVVTCAGCNYGRGNDTLEELGLIDPRTHSFPQSSWDGLERLLTLPRRDVLQDMRQLKAPPAGPDTRMAARTPAV